MRDYELTLIVRPEVDEVNLATLEGKVKDLIAEKGGQVTQVEHWGRRRMAYSIKKIEEGQYVFMLAQLPAQSPLELERQLRLNEQILRYLLVRKE
jgi:small subunit ribosomal protein S6